MGRGTASTTSKQMLREFEKTKPTLGHRVFVDEAALVIGDVSLDDDVSVWPNTVARGDVNFIRIGAVIEDDVLLGAGSLVSPGKRLESGSLYRGRPAERVRPLTDSEREMLLYSATHYVRLKDRYLGRGTGA